MATIDLNRMSKDEFVERYGGIYEHSPWIAESAWHSLQGQDKLPLDSLRSEMRGIVDEANYQLKLDLLQAHPELAGKAATDGKLTAESTEEQASARLDLCSKEEFDQFHVLNAQYNEKFGFPFIIAVKGRVRAEILAAFNKRVGNSIEDEFKTAIEQVHQIASLRLDALDG